MKDFDDHAKFTLDKAPDDYCYEQMYFYLVGELTIVFGPSPYQGYGRYVHELIETGKTPDYHLMKDCPICQKFGDYPKLQTALGKDDKWWFMEHLKRGVFLFKHPKQGILESTKANTISWYENLTGEELDLFMMQLKTTELDKKSTSLIQNLASKSTGQSSQVESKKS
jgi:hypothetical protein